MRKFLSILLVTAFLLLLTACQSTPTQSVESAIPPGTPQSLKFGYGIKLSTQQANVEASLHVAARNGLSWVLLEFNWSAAQPTPDAWTLPPNFSHALETARSLGLFTLVSVQNPPDWALTPAGPDAEQTAQLALKLTLLDTPPTALELFPAANTRAGWGAAPNPAAYARLFETVRRQLETKELPVYLVAGGLHNNLSEPDTIRDVDFLSQLYTTGLRPDIISIQLETLTGDPLAAPAPNTLRHYEEVRAVMNAHEHDDGLLWITHFNLVPENEKETWLKEAHAIMQSQLYLGAVFWDGE
ncbi:MAG: hypothetical protein NZP74_09155 [Anaerolineales bacterium]|nr:hypothetical protein [Anaerolineales bacterium]MDW8276613.1 hypothetical protein [Anaerolineales bacterium]